MHAAASRGPGGQSYSFACREVHAKRIIDVLTLVQSLVSSSVPSAGSCVVPGLGPNHSRSCPKHHKSPVREDPSQKAGAGQGIDPHPFLPCVRVRGSGQPGRELGWASRCASTDGPRDIATAAAECH